MVRRAPLAPLAAIAAVLATALPAAALDRLVEGASPVQDKIQGLYTPIFWVAAVVFVLVEGLLLVTVLKFGPWGKGKETHEHERGNNRLEIAWTIAPAIILIWVGVTSFGVLMDIDEVRGDAPVKLDVVGHQWYWEVRYENGLALKADARLPTGELNPATFFHVPVGEDVLLNVWSEDTQHALNIPALGVKLDAYPGVVNQFWFNADTEGPYFVQCAEYCGTSHAYMHATFVAESVQEFEAWLATSLREQIDAKRWPQAVPLSITDAGAEPEELAFLVGSGTRLVVTNDGARAAVFELGAPFENRTTLAPGETVTHRLTVPGDFAGSSFTVDGVQGTVKANLGRELAARLFDDGSDFRIELEDTTFAPGETVVFRVTNDGTVEHNLYLGDHGAGDALAASATIAGGGATTTLAFTFPDAGTVDYWCNIVGHDGLGMLGEATIEGGA